MFASYVDYLKTSLTTVNKKYTEGYCEGLNFIRETVQRIFLKEIIRPMETIRTFLKPVIDLHGTGAQIKRLRKLNGFSVHELQQIFGFEYPQAIYAWEQGKNAPTIDNLLVLAQLFKVDISEIVVSKTIEVSLPCSEHAAACMNNQGVYCELCRFEKSA